MLRNKIMLLNYEQNFVETIAKETVNKGTKRKHRRKTKGSNFTDSNGAAAYRCPSLAELQLIHA